MREYGEQKPTLYELADTVKSIWNARQILYYNGSDVNMGSYSVSIGTSGGRIYLKTTTYTSLNKTMGANEYPTKLSFAVASGGAYWYN